MYQLYAKFYYLVNIFIICISVNSSYVLNRSQIKPTGSSSDQEEMINSIRFTPSPPLTTTMQIPSHEKQRKVRLVLVRHGETTANRDNLLQGHCNYPLTEDGLKMAVLVGHALKRVVFKKVYSSDLIRAFKTANLIMKARHEDDVSFEADPVEALIQSQQQNMPVQSSSSESSSSSSSQQLLIPPQIPLPPQQQQPLKTSKKLQKQQSLERSILLREVNYGIREALPRGTTVEEAKAILSLKTGEDVEDIEDHAETSEEIIKRQKVFLRQVILDLYEIGCFDYGDDYDNHDVNHAHFKIPNVLCVTHSAFIRNLLSTYSKDGKPFTTKIKNCAISVLELEWKESDPNNFKGYYDDDKINLVDHLLLPSSTTAAAVTPSLSPLSSQHSSKLQIPTNDIYLDDVNRMNNIENATKASVAAASEDNYYPWLLQ